MIEQTGNTLVGLTTLTPDHIKVQTNVVSYYTTTFQKVFEINASTYESSLVRFEEKVEWVKKKLEQDIMYFIPELRALENMYKIENLRKNYLQLKAFCGLLKAMEDTNEWIHKEEGLLKKQISEFPKIKVVHEFLVPFTELIRYENFA